MLISTSCSKTSLPAAKLRRENILLRYENRELRKTARELGEFNIHVIQENQKTIYYLRKRLSKSCY
jgi:hypothetical protein